MLLIAMLCFQTEALSNPMLAALLDDKTGFVELFLQNGLSLREFLTPQVLCQLYTGVRSYTTDSLLFSFSMNLLAFYHECRSLIGYATHYLFCDRI